MKLRSIPRHLWIASNDHCFAVRAPNPKQDGHSIVLGQRPISDWTTVEPTTREAFWEVVESVKKQLDMLRPKPERLQFRFEVHNQDTELHLLPMYADTAPVLYQHDEEPANLCVGGEKEPFLPIVRAGFRHAIRADVVAAFIQDSGLRLLQPTILDALRRGAHIRILTSDYLHITQARALQRLLDWKDQVRLQQANGQLELKIYESDTISFHPKSWAFTTAEEQYAYVGSSNWSYTALCTGIEWNLRLDSRRNAKTYGKLQRSFQRLWKESIPLTQTWVASYVLRCAESESARLPIGEIEEEETSISPTPIQSEALFALQRAREEGYKRALVVLATGLGKTFLSAFDSQSFQARRILFLVHRKEILLQAASSFRQIFPHGVFGWFMDNKTDSDCDVLFASIQKLSRSEHLNQFAPDHFDYIVIDEVHHAAATTYQRLLRHFQPTFLLGLTATPNRSDHLDILPLFDHHIAYRADIAEGIQRKLLVPFVYVGRLDSLDYQAYTLANGELDSEAISAAVQNASRMQIAWEAFQRYPASKTLIFCSSIAHADFASAWLQGQGLRVQSVHSGSTSGPRSESIDLLEQGELDAICTVDLFNEGIDIPSVDRVLMLRPTASPVLFLQQLGRGLRTHPQKKELIVIDIVGNHHLFAERLGSLLHLGKQSDFSGWIHGSKPPSLPAECRMDIELGILDFLRNLLPKQRNSTRQLYEQLFLAQQRRPTLVQLYQLGGKMTDIYQHSRSWFHFVRERGHLRRVEEQCLQLATPWFTMLERTAMTKSFKMIAIQALIEEEALHTGAPVSVFCQRSLNILRRSPLLSKDIPTHISTPEEWERYWLRWLHSTWTSDDPWLYIDNNTVLSRCSAPPGMEIHQMTTEIVQYRLARYRLRTSLNAPTASFLGQPRYKDGHAIISFAAPPPESLRARLPDGTLWSFEIRGKMCSTAHCTNDHSNRLEELLEEYFGAHLFHPAQQHWLQFSRTADGWWLEFIGGSPPSFLDRVEVIRFSDKAQVLDYLAAPNAPQPMIRLPYTSNHGLNHFALRAPSDDFARRSHIHKGHWLLCQWVLGMNLDWLHNRLVIVSLPDQPTLLLRQLQKSNGGYALLSENDEVETIPLPANSTVFGVVERNIFPQELAPVLWEEIPTDQFAKRMGVSTVPSKTEQYIDGLLFLLVTSAGHLSSRTSFPVLQDHSSQEQGYCFAEQNGRYHYLGLAFQRANQWIIPEVHPDIWATFGSGDDGKYRSPPESSLLLAKDFIDQITKPAHRYHPLGHLRVLGANKVGNLLIDGGRGGFQKSSLHQRLIAWALFAKQQAQQCNQPLSEYLLRCMSFFNPSTKEDGLQLRRAIIAVAGQRSKKSFTALQRQQHRHPLQTIGKKWRRGCTEAGAALIYDRSDHPEVHLPSNVVYFILHPFWDGGEEYLSHRKIDVAFWQRRLLERQRYREDRRRLLQHQGKRVEELWSHER